MTDLPGMETTAKERAELAQHLRYVNATGFGSDASVARYDAIQRDFDRLLAERDRAFAAPESPASAEMRERVVKLLGDLISAVDARELRMQSYDIDNPDYYTGEAAAPHLFHDEWLRHARALLAELTGTGGATP